MTLSAWHPQLSTVTLARPVTTGDAILPTGATGTVVHVYPGERGYEVEFHWPFHAVVTVAGGDVA